MKYDILFAGVGGQGVLSMAAIIGRAALAEGLVAKQSEVHGMAQRGGAVQAHLRLSDGPIESDLIPLGTADLILSVEPVESVRYVSYLSPSGALVTAANPFVNIPNYPPVDDILARVRSLPHAIVVDAERIVTEAVDVQTIITVMAGAVAALLPLCPEAIETAVRATFIRKGEAVLDANLRALRGGRDAAAAVERGAIASHTAPRAET